MMAWSACVNDLGGWWPPIASTNHHQSPTTSDQSGSKSVSEKRVAPLDKNAQPVPKTSEIQDVKKEPEPPCGMARDVNSMTEIANGFVASDGRQIALITV